jgi:putative transposase
MRRVEMPHGIRFLTFSCHRRLPLFSNPRISQLFASRLEALRARDGLSVFAWVIMPEHVHLLCRPAPSVRLESTLRALKVSVARQVLTRWIQLRAPILGRIIDSNGKPRFWQRGGVFDRNVRTESELDREIRYIHRNPVERGLVRRPELWPWSSVHWWIDPDSPTLVTCQYPSKPAQSWQSWKGFK